MTDAPDTRPPATVLDRLLAAGISEDRARDHLAGGAVRVDGEQITNPATPAPWPTPWSIGAR